MKIDSTKQETIKARLNLMQSKANIYNSLDNSVGISLNLQDVQS